MTIIAEPGRFFVASAYTLVCQVQSIREVRRDGKIESMMYFINDGVYGSFNCNLTDHKALFPMTLKGSDEKTFRSIIWGPTCDALDQVISTNLYSNRNFIFNLIKFKFRYVKMLHYHCSMLMTSLYLKIWAHILSRWPLASMEFHCRNLNISSNTNTCNLSLCKTLYNSNDLM